MKRKTRGWTPELRAKNAARCRKQKPWTRSTGPKTAAGKAVCAQNSLRHGFRSADYRELCALLRAHEALRKTIVHCGGGK